MRRIPKDWSCYIVGLVQAMLQSQSKSGSRQSGRRRNLALTGSPRRNLDRVLGISSGPARSLELECAAEGPKPSRPEPELLDEDTDLHEGQHLSLCRD